MEITFEEQVDFIPEWNGNQKNAKPIKVTLRPLNASELKRIESYTKKNGGVEYKIDTPLVVSIGVVDIKDLAVNGKYIKDGEKLITIPKLAALCEEISLKIFDISKVDEETAKN
jgi:hypothetical protein